MVQHAFPILSQPFFASRLESLMEMLKESNAMMILSMHYSEALAGKPAFHSMAQACATTVIVPDDMAVEYAAMLPELLSADDQDLLQQIERSHGDILLKQGDATVALCINLDSIPDAAAIFSGDVKTLISAGGPFSGTPVHNHG